MLYDEFNSYKNYAEGGKLGGGTPSHKASEVRSGKVY